jgi:cyclophilin family peptidyl-prolyl cis-trans isomerase
MAHKAPTAVTIAPTQEATGFSSLVERYWKLAVAIAIGISGLIVYLQLAKSSEQKTHDSSWERLMKVAKADAATGLIQGPTRELEAIAGQIEGSEAAPWALYIAASSAIGDRKYDEARAALAKLRAEYPDHPLLRETYQVSEAEGPLSVVERMDRRVEALQAWVGSHPTLFQNPAPAADAPRVRLKTDLGDIVVALDPERAPKHSEQFLKLVREGYYQGTKFHRLSPGKHVAGGDPTTREDDRSKWGQGGTEVQTELEPSGLRHFPGALSAVRNAGGSTTGAGFLLVTGDSHELDTQNVVFGQIVEGLEIVRQIERGTTSPGAPGQPESPVTVQSAEVVP